MLESYVSPFLLGYVDKYIKNLKPEDLQLSLWGGDLVLNKLDLRLDVLEQELNLPMTFVSGHIHELRIHVPWTKLGSEPVVITINTIECALKLRDSEYSDKDSASSKSSASTNKLKNEGSNKAKTYQEQDSDLPPGYVQSLMNRVINNVNIVIKNLILKYVEDDIVLSVNVKSVDSFTVDHNWQRAFVDLTMPELVLRRIIHFSDLTVCLDKRNASGKIETYQEPVVYRCFLKTRIHQTYSSLNAKRASVIKINTYCDELDMSLSDTQLPMFLRLIELLLALYYGTLEVPGKERKEEEDKQDADTDVENKEEDMSSGGAMVTAESQQGWVSWAWSYVPELVYYEDEDEEFTSSSSSSSTVRRKRPDPIVVIGFYCRKGKMLFKLTDNTASGQFSQYGPRKLTFKPLLELEFNGSTIEILMKGDPFFDLQLGFSFLKLSGLETCVCGVEDCIETTTPGRKTCFVQSGDPKFQQKEIHFLYNSLFELGSPENQLQRATYIVDTEQHQAKYTETWGLQRFGAFWLDYIYTMEEKEEKQVTEKSSGSSHQSEPELIFDLMETSSKQFLFSPLKVTVCSGMVHRLQRFVYCALDHEYEPYSTPQPEIVDDNRPVPTPEQVAAIEEAIPLRSTHITLLDLSIVVLAADHPPCDSAGMLTEIAHGPSPTMQHSRWPLPAVCLQSDRIDIQSRVPMYGRKLVRAVSRLPQASGNLMHHCYAHMYLKLFGCQVGLTSIDSSSSDFSPLVLNILPSCSAAAYQKSLVLPVYWTDSNLSQTEDLLELPGISFNITKAQALMVMDIYQSWLAKEASQAVWCRETSLMEDVFKPTAKTVPGGQPVLAAMATNVELKYSENQVVRAASGTIAKAQITMQSLDKGQETTTILYQGPMDTSKLHSIKFLQSDSQVNSDLMNDLMTFTIQVPKTKGAVSVSDGCGIILVDIQGSSVCLDPVIYTWLLYQPRQLLRSKVMSERSLSIESSKKKPSSKESGSQPKEPQVPPVKIPSKSKEIEEPEKKISEEAEEKTEENDFLMDLWNTLKRLTVQIDLQSCFIVLPSQHMAFDTHSPNIPQCLRNLIMGSNQAESSALVVVTPSVSVQSVGHRKMSPLQEIPLHWKDLPPDTGEKLPWNLRASSFSVYTAHSFHTVYYLLHPMGMAATFGVTASAITPAASRPGLGLCIHADMQAVVTSFSHPQVLLMYKLFKQVTSVAPKILTAFTLPTSTSTFHFSTTPAPTSPSKSMRVLSSVTSSGQPDLLEATSVSSPVESLASPTPADGDSLGRGMGLKLSLWLQWTLQKFVVKLYSKGSDNADMKMTCTIEDLTSSIDVQDVYSKISCKVGALNIMHYTKREDDPWSTGAFKGVVFSCDDTITHDTHMPGVNIASKSTARSFNPFAASNTKPTDIKKAHSFLTFTWTRALSKSVSQKMFGRKLESLTKLSPKEQASSSEQFVNEVIIASRPFDLVLWCPVLSLITELFLIDAPAAEQRAAAEQIPVRSRRKCSPSSTSMKSTSESQTRLSTHQKVPSKTEWFTNQNLPLIYMDCKDFRVFIPAKSTCTTEVDKSSEQGSETRVLEEDTFILQVNSVVLSPHADNPLQRLVVKKDIYRKAVQSGITDRPGSDIEDRQYQLDINGMTMSVASWEQIDTVTDQSKVKLPASSSSMTQNPALEWNTSLPRQSPEVVFLTPIVVGFDLRVVAAPAIVAGKAIICGHSLEVNATSDVTFYISTQHICLAQIMMQQNLQSLTSPMTKHDARTSAEHAYRHSPVMHYRKTLQLEDSGIGSEESMAFEASHQVQQFSRESGAPKPLTGRQIVMKQKLLQRASIMPSHNRAAKTKSKRLTPSDILFTAGKFNVFLYSKESTGPSSPPSKQSGSIQQLIGTSASVESSTLAGGRIQPFLHLEVSQPSAIASLERHQQKIEFSIYDVNLDGVSVRNSTIESTEPLPSAPDYTVPWFETCPGEPDTKTGVRPSLVTLTVGNILSKKASLKLNIARPVKTNLSLTKMEQCTEFMKKMRLPKSVEIDSRAKARTSVGGRTQQASPKTHRPGSVPLIIPAMGQAQHSTQPSDSSSSEDAINLLLNITDITMEIVQFVVVIATVPDPLYPHMVLSIEGCQGKAGIVKDNEGKTSELTSTLDLNDFQVKTSLQHKTRPLLGPVTMETSLKAKWDDHTGGPREGGFPRMALDIHLGHVPVFFGQEHLTCFTMIQNQAMEYIGMQVQSKPKQKAAPAPGKHCNRRDLAEDSSTDDLRVGAFKYITDSDGRNLQPKPNEIVFSCPPPLEIDESIEDYGNWGSMSWCYPQPRVLTRVSVTPIPLRLATSPDEPRGEYQVEEIPCTLEYWDDMRKCYHTYKQLFVAEAESYLFTVDMPFGETDLKMGEAVAAQIWRVVLNSTSEDCEEAPLSQSCRKNLIISPTALAASMRIDSYFAAHLIPTAIIAFNMDCLEIRLSHHTSQLGQGQPHQMKPFKFDGLAPNEQEFMVISVDNTELYGQHWTGGKQRTAVQLFTSLQCDLLTYRNLTMMPFIEETGIEGSLEAHWGHEVGCLIDLGSVEFRVGQGAIHTLNMALQAWGQYGKPDEEQLVFTYFTICNDTSEALRFGQVHTDEALVLGSRQMHAYSWRTHKHHEQFLHVCIEGWRNWRWSEPFNIDTPGTVVRTLEYKEQKATLFIKIKQISLLQKQVTFSGQQIFTSRLTETLEVQLLHLSRVGEQLVNSQQVYMLSSKDTLPSLTCCDEDISGVRIRIADKDKEVDWSEQFAISGEMSRKQVIVTIPSKEGPPLYLWCCIYTEDIQGFTQRLITFSPLFIVRSHLPRPLVVNLQSQKLHDLQLVEAAGKGADQPLYHVTPDVWFNMTFQLSQTASPSSPAIPVSTELIHQVTLQPDDDDDVTMETLCADWEQDLSAAWPYNQPDYDSSISYPCSLRHTGLPLDETDQPNTDLQVSLCQYWAELNTVLIDVMPWCLVVNETDRDMLILEDGERPVRCGRGQTVSPQRFKGPFHICAITEACTETNWSSPIHLLTEPTSPRADSIATGSLALTGDGFVHVQLPNQHDNKIIHVTLTSTIQHNVRVMTVRPRFILVNNTKRDVKLRAVHVNLGEDEHGSSQQTTLYSHFLPSNPSSRNPLPVFEWNVLPSSQPKATEVFQQCVQLISLAVCQKYSASQQRLAGADMWSSWIYMDEGQPRQPITILDTVALHDSESDGNRTVTIPVVAILQENDGVVYISLEIDPSPLVTVHNTCLFPLHIGKAQANHKDAVKVRIVEETGILPSIPIIPANSVFHYNIRQIANPQSNRETPTIHLSLAQHPGAVIYQNTDRSQYQWSEGIVLATGTETRSEIVALTGGGYVLVTSYNVGRQTCITIDPLSMNMPRGYPVGPQNQLMAGAEQDQSLSAETPTKTQPSSVSATTDQQFNFNLDISKLVVKVMDEVTDLVMTSEIMRATLDNIKVLSYPAEDAGRKKVKSQIVTVSTGPFQIDNQMFSDGKYDFGVLFKSRHKLEEDTYVMPDLPLESDGCCQFILCLESDGEIGTNIAYARIHLEDTEVFVEDQFMYEMLTRTRSYVPASQPTAQCALSTQTMPSKLKAQINSLRSPVGMRNLEIHPISVLASIHASLKVYIAVDRTLLSFSQFETGPVFASSSQLIEALTLHFTSGALFKAGWALGSLEILGNPAGFLRSVKTGLTDTVLLPYEGLTRGPAAFVSGVTNGVTSLVRHVSAGTLTSVTKFASSVSRNLDRLSLDADHIARQEAQRRKAPDRVTEGLMQGLSGFGISLLGAIAGIADQPLQSIQEASGSSTPTTVKATSIITGVGKGLVGVVIKPLGGAAEFVAQTGQGILHGVGLADAVKPRSSQFTELSAMASNSRLKYTWKMLHSLPNADIIMHVDVTSVTFHGLHRSGCLLLTPEILFVVSASEDTQQQAFPVSDVECVPLKAVNLDETNSSLLCIVPKRPMSPSSQEKEDTTDRVAEFVDKTSGYATNYDQLNVSSDSQSDASAPSMIEGAPTYQYFMDRRHRATFLSLFVQAKNRLSGKGFCYDETDTTNFSRFKMWHLTTKAQLDD